MQPRDYVILVDEHDNALGVAEKLAAHRTAQLHRAFSVFIFRQTECGLETLLQQRQHTKYHSAGLWTNACCSHPQPGETVLAAGTRRLQEEMGISATLQAVSSFIYRANVAVDLIEYEFDHVLIGNFTKQEISVNSHEVAAYAWLPIVDLQHDLQQRPQRYTAWFASALALALQNFIPLKS